jgi:WS/DGAT/MGAT family acyltransferase
MRTFEDVIRARCDLGGAAVDAPGSYARGRGRADAGRVIARLSSNDLAELAADVGPDPRLVGAAVILDGPPLDVAEVRSLVATRLRHAPLLTRRLRRVPRGCGRPLWEEVVPDLTAHVSAATCPAPGDLDALLALTARLAGEPLPPDRPWWRLVVVDRMADGAAALVWFSHHAAADGPGTLRSVLTVLGEAPDDGTLPRPPDDGAQPRPPDAAPAPVAEAGLPSRRALVRDTALRRVAALRRLPHGLALLAAAALELAGSAGARAPRTVLNRPVESGIRLLTADVDLAHLRAAARSCGATVNDAVLCAFGRTVHAELAARGAPVGNLVVGCPVTVGAGVAAGGSHGEPAQNRVGVVRLPVPAPDPRRPDVRTHLTRIAALTGPRKRHLSAASTVVLSPVFRALAAAGLYRPMVDRQRTVSTLVTNLRGPEQPVRLCGRVARAMVPVTPIVGNVPIAAVALSYAGRLSVTVRLAPSLWGAAERVRHDLVEELGAVASLGGGEAIPAHVSDS